MFFFLRQRMRIYIISICHKCTNCGTKEKSAFISMHIQYVCTYMSRYNIYISTFYFVVDQALFPTHFIVNILADCIYAASPDTKLADNRL